MANDSMLVNGPCGTETIEMAEPEPLLAGIQLILDSGLMF